MVYNLQTSAHRQRCFESSARSLYLRRHERRDANNASRHIASHLAYLSRRSVRRGHEDGLSADYWGRGRRTYLAVAFVGIRGAVLADGLRTGVAEVVLLALLDVLAADATEAEEWRRRRRTTGRGAGAWRLEW